MNNPQRESAGTALRAALQNLRGSKNDGSLLVGVPRRDGSSASNTLTFQMLNLIAGTMYDGIDPTLPSSMTLDLSTYAESGTVISRDTIMQLIDANYASSTHKVYPPTSKSIPLESIRIFRFYVNDDGPVYNFKYVNGQLMYSKQISPSSWLTVPENAQFKIVYNPCFKYVRFDPNSADSDVDTGGIFTGAYTDANGKKEGDQYLLTYFKTTSASSASNAVFDYSLLDASDWPGTPHLIAAPDVEFMEWQQTFYAVGYNLSKYVVSSASTALYIQRTHNTNGALIRSDDCKPRVHAVYKFRYLHDETSQAPLWPDENGHYPSQGGGLEPGEVKATKDAEWVDRTAGIGKITLTVHGAPIHEGADVIIIMDQSVSMGHRFNTYYPDEREAPEKIAVWNAVNTLLGEREYNNRVALVSFADGGRESHEEMAIYLRNPDGIEDLQTMLQGWGTYGYWTFYDAGLRLANDILDARTAAEQDRPVYVLFLTDGEPNGNNGQIGTLSNKLRNTYGATVYAVGIQTKGSSAGSWLKTIAGNASRVVEIDEPDELDGVVSSIVDTIVGAGTDAMFTDTISDYFDAFTDAELTAYNSAHGTSYAHSPEVTVSDHKNVTVDVGAITGTPDNPQTFEIYIKIEPDHVGDVNLEEQKTNDDIVLDYKDHTGTDQQIPKEEIGDPDLGRFKNAVQIIYTLVDENGNYIDQNGNPTSTPVQIGATLERAGLDLIDQATRNYTVYADVNPNGSTTIDQSEVLGKIWGAIPAGGYLLYGADNQTATISENDDPDDPPVIEFKLYIPVPKTDITVTKIWDDENNQRGKRPSSVEVTLLADGEEVETVTLRGDDWTYTWTDLPLKNGSRTIVYTVSEERVPGYQKPVITGNAANGFYVTNRLWSSNSPFTGDNRAWLPWVGVLVLSGAALGVDAIVRGRKKRKERD